MQVSNLRLYLPTRSASKLLFYLIVGLAGTLLILIPAEHYRLDLTSCTNWPSPSISFRLSIVYLVAIGLMTVCWLGWWTANPCFASALGAGLLLHAGMLLAPFFLSMDPLFYAAIGRAMAKFHGSPYTPLSSILPPDDPVLRMLPIDWQNGTSAYFPGWNEITRAIALLAGDSIIAQFKMYQAIGLVSMTATAAIAGIAAEKQQAGRAVAAVLLCPLGLLEGTQAAHNDHLLALSISLFVLATVKRRPLLGLLALALGAAVKASAILLLCIDSVALLSSRARTTVTRLSVATVALIAGVVFFASPLAGQLSRITPLLDISGIGSLYCVRAVECIPRYLLYRLHFFNVGWGVGFAFRIAGGLWLLYVAFRSGRDGRVLSWSALGIFVYYTYFHAHWQAWYLLSLLPLLPFSGQRIRPAMAAACVSAVSYYAVLFPFNCLRDPTLLFLESCLQTTMIIVPPSVLLWRSRRAVI